MNNHWHTSEGLVLVGAVSRSEQGWICAGTDSYPTGCGLAWPVSLSSLFRCHAPLFPQLHPTTFPIFSALHFSSIFLPCPYLLPLSLMCPLLSQPHFYHPHCKTSLEYLRGQFISIAQFTLGKYKVFHRIKRKYINRFTIKNPIGYSWWRFI